MTMPWLFSGWFLRFWPLVVMAIAFVGVGLGELFQRRRQRVLSEPLQTTGALLPLLPALGVLGHVEPALSGPLFAAAVVDRRAVCRAERAAEVVLVRRAGGGRGQRQLVVLAAQAETGSACSSIRSCG